MIPWSRALLRFIRFVARKSQRACTQFSRSNKISSHGHLSQVPNGHFGASGNSSRAPEGPSPTPELSRWPFNTSWENDWELLKGRSELSTKCGLTEITQQALLRFEKIWFGFFDLMTNPSSGNQIYRNGKQQFFPTYFWHLETSFRYLWSAEIGLVTQKISNEHPFPVLLGNFWDYFRWWLPVFSVFFVQTM